jgi:type II secretory pathway component GspD/PulD (secretin)
LIDTPEKLRELEEFIKKTDLPVQTKVFGLNYAQADKFSPKLQEVVTKGIGSIKIDERTNKIVVTDYPQKLDDIAGIIAAFDEKTPQVLIDAQIIEIKPSDKFEMGVDWDYWITKYFEMKLSLPISTTNRLLIGTPSNTPGKPGEYKAIIDLLRTIGDTKVLSSPRITVLNNQEAKIHLGTRDAYITSTISQAGTGTTVTSQEVNFVDIGIQLSVTPTINRDGFVAMKIRPEVSSAETKHITSQGLITDVPIVSTSEAETAVMIKDGVTIIIGGLRKDEKTKTVKKVPVIGDIPLLGFLFRSTSDEVKTTDLVILLTPHIVSGESSYTDFSEVKPREGAVAKMVRGQVVKDKMSTTKQEEALGRTPVDDETAQDYYSLIINKINRFAKANRPKNKYGRVTVVFSLSLDGKFIGEPYCPEATDPDLIPAAIKAVKGASPFPAFPPGLHKEEESFRVALEYK